MKAVVTCTKCGQESKATSHDEFKFARLLIKITDELLAHDEVCKVKKSAPKKKYNYDLRNQPSVQASSGQ